MTAEERFFINFRQIKVFKRDTRPDNQRASISGLKKAWVSFELGMRNGDHWPNLAIGHLFGIQKNVRSCWKIQEWKTRIFLLHQKHRRREKMSEVFN